MKIIKNEKHIKRNGTIGNWASIAGIIMVGVPVYLYFQALMQKSFDNLDYILLMTLTFGGLILSQIGTALGTRYGRSPRPDERLDAALKGLQNEFSIYHYTTQASHLLVGPAGIWLLLPYNSSGRITYKKNRWRLSGGGFMQGYLRLFGFEGIGRPDHEIDSEAKAIQKQLAKHMETSEIPPIQSLLILTNENVEIDSADAPVPALKLKQIKDFFRQKAKEKPIGQTQLAAVRAALPE